MVFADDLEHVDPDRNNVRSTLSALKGYLVSTASIIQYSLPTAAGLCVMAECVQGLQLGWGQRPTSPQTIGQTRNVSHSLMWSLQHAMRIDEHLLALMPDLHDRLILHNGDASLQGINRRSNNSTAGSSSGGGRAASNNSGGGGGGGDVGDGHGSGSGGGSDASKRGGGRVSRNDRAGAAANALRMLQERRDQADTRQFEAACKADRFPVLLMSLLSSTLSVFVTLFATASFSPGGADADALFQPHVFDFLEYVMHYLLQCIRLGGISKASIHALLPPGSNPLHDATVNACVAVCSLFQTLGCLPVGQHGPIINSFPSRFVDTLSCLAVEGLGELRSCSLAAQKALLMVATLPHHVNVRNLFCSSSSSSSNGISSRGYATHSNKAAQSIAWALSTPHFLRAACKALVIVLPFALKSKPASSINHSTSFARPSLNTNGTNIIGNNTSGTHTSGGNNGGINTRATNTVGTNTDRSDTVGRSSPVHSKAVREALLGELRTLVPTLTDILVQRQRQIRYETSIVPAWFHAVLVEGAAASMPKGGGGDGDARVDPSGPWTLTGPTNMASVVMAVCRFGGYAATQRYARPEFATAAADSAELVTLLLALERGESAHLSAYAPRAVQLRAVMDGAAYLAASLGRLIEWRQQMALRCAQVTSPSEEEESNQQPDVGCCGVSAVVVTPEQHEGLRLDDVHKKLVTRMLKLCDPDDDAVGQSRIDQDSTRVGEFDWQLC